MTDARIAQRGKGVLRVFNEAKVLGAADVHIAVRLAQMAGESSEDAVLATALAVRAVRSGSVCLEVNGIRDIGVDAVQSEDGSEIDLDALPWPEPAVLLGALRASPLVVGGAAGPLRPLRLVDTDVGSLLYLEKYHRQEETVRRVLDSRAGDHPDVDVDALRAGLAELFPGAEPDRQRVAVAVAATHRTAVIAGGPGTGKTHTVARVLAMLRRLHGDGLRIGLAAPTGKAAARLQESVRAQDASLGLPPTLAASTLHRLLGWGHNGPRYHAGNHLPYDVIVVDETSMVSLTMMCRLLEALRPQTRLVLVGDPNQLASVDAGAVLADLVDRPVTVAANPVLDRVVGADLETWTADERDRLRGGIVRLTRGWRFDRDIGALADAVRDEEEDRVIDLLRAGGDQIEFLAPDDLDALRREVVGTAVDVVQAAEAGDVAAALDLSERHRLLCAHRDGPYGVAWWERASLEWIGAEVGHRLDPDALTAGRPLLVTANDYDARIYNGDTGVVVRRGDGELVAAFARGAEPLILHPSRLSSTQSVYAMTIHRSQGSQYGTVSVILPDERSSLLTRELLYTAITRAKDKVRIIGTEDAVREAVRRKVRRASGLRLG
ncbi:RecBCD enzyme subunit RecD [Rhodococcus sp. RD6.2]|uniref:exodeoxyribonuclease V subunit alpha n=1 Tax=Rhodococcus sp. RD6.2 TaxID=260936 RepID=UPI00063B15E2|nr:exodeoxyribonuclease V subunit alpha [Rhodococcus sp. RD6.2]CRK50456.1 RecBCD enzyme subunit RecD [Rhodococcus sp. RD6.2]